MSSDVQLLAYSAILTWIMIMTSSTLRYGVTPKEVLEVGMGNREDMPKPTAVAGRADRAAKNMLENLVLFVAVLLAAHGANGNPARILLGARLFFFARLAYFPIYVAGIRYLRTVVWSVAVAGMALIVATAI